MPLFPVDLLLYIAAVLAIAWLPFLGRDVEQR